MFLFRIVFVRINVHILLYISADFGEVADDNITINNRCRSNVWMDYDDVHLLSSKFHILNLETIPIQIESNKH